MYTQVKVLHTNNEAALTHLGRHTVVVLLQQGLQVDVSTQPWREANDKHLDTNNHFSQTSIYNNINKCFLLLISDRIW